MTEQIINPAATDTATRETDATSHVYTLSESDADTLRHNATIDNHRSLFDVIMALSVTLDMISDDRARAIVSCAMAQTDEVYGMLEEDHQADIHTINRLLPPITAERKDSDV